MDKLIHNPSISTAVLPFIGYHKAGRLAEKMKTDKLNIFEANKQLQLMDENKLKKILTPQYLLKTGFTIRDITSED